MKASEIQINRRPEKTHVRTVAFFASFSGLTVWLLLFHSTGILGEMFKGLRVASVFCDKSSHYAGLVIIVSYLALPNLIRKLSQAK